VTHPFHPLSGSEFELVTTRETWGLARAYYHDARGELLSMPLAWTSARAVDPFVELSAGRSPFRVHDLLELAALLRGLAQDHRREGGHV
jgi:hypothetical protein